MTAIEFENISKQYHLGKIGTGTLSKVCATEHEQIFDCINGLPLKLSNESAYSLVSQELTIS